MADELSPTSKHIRRAICAAGLSVTVLLANTMGQAAISPDTSHVVTPRVEIDRPVVVRGDNDPIFVLVRFEARDLLPQERDDRPPLNLALVLDRSGSMEDRGKIEYLKQAAKMAVDRLGASDHLAVVEYDDRITVMWPSQRVESVFPIKRLIDQLSPRGSTNLVGGMMQGADEVQNRMGKIDAENTINRVLLLSDGLANEGVTEPAQIRRLVRGAKANGVRISTMGLGRDYDEDLMQAIAESAGGNYYFIEHPNQMARIFEQELNTLFTTIAKDVRFEFTPADGVSDVQVISFGDVDDSGSTRFDIENFYGGESRTLLLRLEADSDVFDRPGGTVDLGDIGFSYKNVETGERQTFEADIQVEITDDRSLAEAAKNHEVIVEANLFEVERQHKEAIALYESGNMDDAKARLASLETEMRSRNATLKDARLANKIEALSVEQVQMEEAAQDADIRSSYLKNTKQRLYKAQQGKRALYMLQLGDKGYEVERLQTALKDAGYYSGDIDGVYGEELKTAVEDFQSANAIAADGLAGPNTMKELNLY